VTHKIVEIRWRDSAAIRGWRSTQSVLDDSLEDDYLDCKTAGYVLESTDDRTVIAQNLSTDGEHVSDVITIPNEAITGWDNLTVEKNTDGQADRQTPLEAWRDVLGGGGTGRQTDSQPPARDGRKEPCLYPLPGGERCCECATCHPVD